MNEETKRVRAALENTTPAENDLANLEALHSNLCNCREMMKIYRFDADSLHGISEAITEAEMKLR